jgi:hypothetical protein
MPGTSKRTEQRNMKNAGYIPVRAWMTPEQAQQAQAWNDKNLANGQYRKAKEKS